jgi:hypothetical protein
MDPSVCKTKRNSDCPLAHLNGPENRSKQEKDNSTGWQLQDSTNRSTGQRSAHATGEIPSESRELHN